MKRRSFLILSLAVTACERTASRASVANTIDVLPPLVFAEVNAWRQRRRLGRLRPNARLAQAATTHARDIAARNVTEHVGSDGSRIGRRTDRVGYEYQNVYEIIAGVPSDDDRAELARAILRTWENSPDHRRAMLEPDVVDGGVGVGVNTSLLGPDRVYAVMVLARPF